MDLLKAYSVLTEVCRTTSDTTLPSGMGGMWTPDYENDNGDLILRAYSGGYEHTLCSRKFKFELVEGYTNAKGTEAHLSRGTEADVQAALDFYAAAIQPGGGQEGHRE